MCVLLLEVPATLEIGLVPVLKNGQYPGLFLFSTPARMMRPVRNLATGTQELIGSFEQVTYLLLHIPFACLLIVIKNTIVSFIVLSVTLYMYQYVK